MCYVLCLFELLLKYVFWKKYRYWLIFDYRQNSRSSKIQILSCKPSKSSLLGLEI